MSTRTDAAITAGGSVVTDQKTTYESLVSEYRGVQSFPAVRAFFRRALLSEAMGEISQVELDSLRALGEEDREQLAAGKATAKHCRVAA